MLPRGSSAIPSWSTSVVAAGAGQPRAGTRRAAPGAVLIDQVVHCEHHACELATGNLEVARALGADRDDHGVVISLDRVPGWIHADLDAAAQLDVAEQREPAIDDRLLDLEVGDPV